MGFIDGERRLGRGRDATDGVTFPAGLAFAVSTRRLSKGAFVVAATGELDLYTAPELEAALAGVLTEAPGELFVDLSEVTFVDSTALHVLLRATRQRAAEDGALIVVARDANVRRAFEITGFDRLLSIVASLPSMSAS